MDQPLESSFLNCNKYCVKNRAIRLNLDTKSSSMTNVITVDFCDAEDYDNQLFIAYRRRQLRMSTRSTEIAIIDSDRGARGQVGFVYTVQRSSLG